jgi:hypothetical protein
MSKSTLQSKVQALALSFATGLADGFSGQLMEIILSSPIDEIAGLSRNGGSQTSSEKSKPEPKAGKKAGKKGRLPRRSEEDIAKGVERIVKLVNSKPNGLRAEQIKEALGLDVRELPRLLADALASKQVTKTGNKRATTYFGKGKKAAAKPAAKKAAPKKKAAKKKAAPKTVSVKAGVVKAKAKKKVAPKKKAAPAKAAEATPAAEAT